MSAVLKAEHLIGFDQARNLLWPMARLDPLRLSLKMQVMRVVFAICLKRALDEAALERDRERVFAEMARDLERLRQAGGTTPRPTGCRSVKRGRGLFEENGLASRGAKI